MNICFMCDLHLPYGVQALQYDVWKWAMEDARSKCAECIIFAGDVTADGNISVCCLNR